MLMMTILTLLLSKLLEGYVRQNILQDQTFCHDKQHGFMKCKGQCDTYQNYTHHRCVKSDTWWQMAWYLILVQDYIPTSVV